MLGWTTSIPCTLPNFLEYPAWLHIFSGLPLGANQTCLLSNPQKRGRQCRNARSQAASSPHAAQSPPHSPRQPVHSLLAMPSRRQQQTLPAAASPFLTNIKARTPKLATILPTSPFRTPASTSTKSDRSRQAAAPHSNPSHRSPTPPPTPSTGRR